MRPDNIRNGGSNITKIKFHDVFSVALTSGAAQLTVAPTNLGSLSDVAQSFNLYKVTKLRYRIHPQSAMTLSQTAAYYPETVVTSATAAANMENPDCIVQYKDTTVPTPWHSVPPARLQGQLEWWKCVADASAGDFEIQGVLALTGTTTETVYLEIDGIIHMKNPVDTTTAAARMRSKILSELKSGITAK